MRDTRGYVITIIAFIVAVMLMLAASVRSANADMIVTLDHDEGPSITDTENDNNTIHSGIVGHYLWVLYGPEVGDSDHEDKFSVDVSDPTIEQVILRDNGTVEFIRESSLQIFALTQTATVEVCPEDGRVTSETDGDLDDIVLNAGTVVCIKGATTLVEVTADGESTLRQLLGINKNVSHYTILEVPPSATTTTTTSIPATTTTIAETTTTVPPTTTTSEGATTTTIERSTTTTTQPLSSTTTQAPESTTTSMSDPTTSTPTELPYTGSRGWLWIAGLLALVSGGGLVAYGRTR